MSAAGNGSERLTGAGRGIAHAHRAPPQLEGEKLSFELPISLPTLKDKSTSFVKLSNGAEACFFKASDIDSRSLVHHES